MCHNQREGRQHHKALWRLDIFCFQGVDASLVQVAREALRALAEIQSF